MINPNFDDSVWCVMNIYEDGSEELSSIHKTEESADHWMESGKSLIEKYNPEFDKKIVEQVKRQWFVL